MNYTKRKQRRDHKDLLAKLGPTRIYCTGCNDLKVQVHKNFPDKTRFQNMHIDTTADNLPICTKCDCPLPSTLPYVQWMLDTWFIVPDRE